MNMKNLTIHTLYFCSHHMVHEQLVAGIKQLNADEGYIDSTSFPATPAPSPFSPSPAQVSQFSPDQVAEGIQRLREEATREERSGSILSNASGLLAARLATSTGVNQAHERSSFGNYSGIGMGGYGIGGSSGTSTGQPPTPSSTPGPPGLAAAAIAHHQLGVIPEHLAESIHRNLRPTDEGLESTSSPGTPVPTPISPSLSHQMQQSNVLPEQLVAGIHRLKEVEGMSSGGSSALPSTPAPTPYSHHPGGVRPEDLAEGISRLSVIEEGDVQQQQPIAINISAHEAAGHSQLTSANSGPKLSQYFTHSSGISHQTIERSIGTHPTRNDGILKSGGENFFDDIPSQSQGPLKFKESQKATCTTNIASSAKEGKESALDPKIEKYQKDRNIEQGEACLDVVEQVFDDARSLQRRTSQEQVKHQSRSRNESYKTEEDEPKLCTFFSESKMPFKDNESNVASVSENVKQSENQDPFDAIAMNPNTPKSAHPTSLETLKVSEEQTSNYSTPVAPTPTIASSIEAFSNANTNSATGSKQEEQISYSTYSSSIPPSATPLLQPAIPRFNTSQPIRSPLPLDISNTMYSSKQAISTSSKNTGIEAKSKDEKQISEHWNRSESEWMPCQSTSHVLANLAPGSTPDRNFLTTPSVHAREDLHDPIKSLVARYRGEAESGKRHALTADMVSQDLTGLFQLIESGCFRAAVNLTTRILAQYGQGSGQNGAITRHSPTSLKVWYIRLFLLVQLKQFSTVEVEAEPFGDLDNPDLYYEYYNRIEPQYQQESGMQKIGSMVPFGFRLLLAELPQHLGKHHEAIDRLHQLLATIEKMLKNMKNNTPENSQTTECNENAERVSTLQLWKKRKRSVLYTISNCAIMQKDFELSIMNLEILYELSDSIEEKISIKSSIGRVYLQLGDVTVATECFEVAKELRKNKMQSETGKKYTGMKVDELIDDALVSMSTNNFADALNILEEADRLAPGNSLVINNKSVCLLYLGRLKDALTNLESELTRNPKNILKESHVLNLATLYELESSYAGQKKQALLDIMSQYAGDGANTACLKF